MANTEANVIVGLGDGFIKIGTYGQAEGAATDVGYTDGGCTIKLTRDYYKKKCDQSLGTLEAIKTAEEATLTFTMAEASLNMLRLAMDYPSTALTGVTDLVVGGDASVNELTIYLNVVGVSGGSRKYTFHKCVVTSASTHSYKKDDKTMIEMEVLVLQDTAQAADAQLFAISDTGADTTPPTVALSTPVDGGTVVQGTSGVVVWTITEAQAIDESSVIYGDNDNATFMIINTTVHATAALVAGTIVYNSALKTVTFTPTAVWTTAHTFQAIVTTGLRDCNGNHLAAMKIEQFQAT